MTTATSPRLLTLASTLVWAGAAALFLLPAVAMQFTAEVNWTAADFVVWAAMLLLTASGYEFIARRAPNWTYRGGAAVAIVAGFFLIWVNLAVGIIGSESNDANMMYAGVLAVAVGGSLVARLRARGMTRAMLATAAAQVLVAAIAISLDLGADGPIWPRDVIGATTMVTIMWLASAALFARAG